MKKIYVYMMAAMMLASCTEKPENVTKVDKLPAIFPDYSGVLSY